MAPKTLKNQDKKIAALYCRVSTIDQSKADFSSLKTQEQMLREKCVREGWKVYKVYVDTKSGSTLDRPEIVKLLHDAEEKKFNVVVATKLDRISRSVKDFIELDEKLNSLGVDITLTTQPIDTTTPAGKMQRNVMMSFAQFEREIIAERTRESTYARAKKGMFLGGIAPLGYDNVNKRLEINKEEAALVNKIFKWYLESPSTRAISRKLNSEGYKTKIRTTKTGKRTGGIDFNYQLVHDILRNKLYLGLIKVGDKTYPGQHEQIIDDKLFDQVQKRLDLSTVEPFVTLEGSPLLLLGTTKCGQCGANLTTYFASNGKSPEKHYYYKCTTAIKKGATKCPSRLVPARDLEQFTSNLMIHTAEKEGFFEAITSQVQDNSSIELIQIGDDLQQLRGNLSSIDKKIDNIVSNLMDEVFENAAKKRLAVELENLSKRKEEIENRISEQSVVAGEIEGKKFEKQALRQILKEFESVYQTASDEDKKRMLRTFMYEIEVTSTKGDKEGSFEFKIRGNGTIVKEWNEVIKKTRGVGGLTPRVRGLRG